MGTMFHSCGCAVTSSMFTGEILNVHHCQEHKHLYSEHKTISQMADEIPNA